jgi:hypothetical protein
MSELSPNAQIAANVIDRLEKRLAVAEHIIATVFVNLRMTSDLTETAKKFATIDEARWLDTGIYPGENSR